MQAELTCFFLVILNYGMLRWEEMVSVILFKEF